MSLIKKVKLMFGLQPKVVTERIAPDISKAVQRNEAAGQRAQQALEEFRMSNTLRDVVGKMK